MMRKLSWMSLVLLVLVGCGEEITKEEVKPKTVCGNGTASAYLCGIFSGFSAYTPEIPISHGWLEVRLRHCASGVWHSVS